MYTVQEENKIIDNLCIFDNKFMQKIFEDKKCVEKMMKIILEDQRIYIKELHTEFPLHNLQGRSAYVDLYFIDSKASFFNIEIQGYKEGAIPRRARLHASLLNGNIIAPREKWKDLPQVYIIFICKEDYLRKGLPIYHIQRKIEETGENFDDGEMIIYINGEIEDRTPLGKLMHDFKCIAPDDMYYDFLADRVRYFKKTKEGRKKMSQLLEELFEQGKEEGRMQGTIETSYEIAKAMILDGKLSIEDISSYTGLKTEEVENLQFV